MPRPRKQLVSISDTPYYHVTSRCVRRAFLCGKDLNSGRSYEHRQDWIEHRIRVLSSLFTVDVCAYAVMSNHYHLVLKLVPDLARSWSDNDVLERWCSMFKGPTLVQRYRADVELDDIERETLRDITAVFRKRLTSLSWFMKCLNEPIARKANKEDHCTGHFWEARFSSQALKSEAALLCCMTYVDLNPVRAQMAKTPEASKYTSIHRRLGRSSGLRTAIQEMLAAGDLRAFAHPVRRLLEFSDKRQVKKGTIPISFDHYLQLLDATGRTVRQGSRGTIDQSTTPILERLHIDGVEWLRGATQFEEMHRNRQIIGATSKSVA